MRLQLRCSLRSSTTLKAIISKLLAFTSNRAGLKRTDTLWKAIGKAAVIHQVKRHARLVLLTTDAPAPGSAGAHALDQVVGDKRPIRDVIEMLHVDDQRRLSGYAKTKRVAADR